jgi:hypothetical protein
MRMDRSAGLFLLSLSLGSVPVRAADPAPLTVLKEKGLTKSGTTYVIEAEKPVLQKMKEVKATFAIYARLAERQAMEEQVAGHLTQLEQQQTELQAQLTDLNQQITEQAITQPNNGPRAGPFGGSQASAMIARRDQIKATLAEVTQAQKTLKAQAPQEKGRAALDDEVKNRGEAFKAALAELRPMVDEVTKKYADLEADESIKKARNDLQKATRATIKLGPSDAFKAGARALDQAERQFLGKKSAPVAKKKAKSKK